MLTALGEEARKAKATMNDGLLESTKLGPINNKVPPAMNI